MARRILVIAGLVLVAGTALRGQGAAPPAQGAPAPAGRGGGAQGPQIVSPQVNADRTITLRLNAPRATEVTVTGEILNGAQAKPMTKGADGIWTATSSTSTGSPDPIPAIRG